MKNAPYDGYYKYDWEVAQTYNQSRKHERHWEKEDEFVGMYMQSRHVEDLLDLPVGTGRFFKHYTDVRRLTGVDISKEMLAKAKEQLSFLPNEMSVCLEQHDVLALPFRDAAFDAVIVFRLFHLMPEISLDLAIKELCRVCRKDVVAQTYPPMKGIWHYAPGRLGAVFRKIASFLRHRTPSAQTTSSVKPWSHIRAYYHEQRLIDTKFAMHGFLPSTSTLLDIYESTEVRATVYSKTI